MKLYKWIVNFVIIVPLTDKVQKMREIPADLQKYNQNW